MLTVFCFMSAYLSRMPAYLIKNELAHRGQLYFTYVLNNPILLRYFSDLERAISCSWQRISMKFADYFECFVILFAFVILNVECEINTILTVSLNFTAKSWIMVSSLLVPDLDRCLALGHVIKKYSLVTYVLKFELDYLFIKDIKKTVHVMIW